MASKGIDHENGPHTSSYRAQSQEPSQQREGPQEQLLMSPATGNSHESYLITGGVVGATAAPPATRAVHEPWTTATPPMDSNPSSPPAPREVMWYHCSYHVLWVHMSHNHTWELPDWALAATSTHLLSGGSRTRKFRQTTITKRKTIRDDKEIAFRQRNKIKTQKNN